MAQIIFPSHHFAIKAKLYLAAVQTAFRTLASLQPIRLAAQGELLERNVAMSLQNAFLFIHRARTNAVFGEEVRKLSIIGESNLLEQFVAAENIPCTIEELQQAYQQDWSIRWYRNTMTPT